MYMLSNQIHLEITYLTIKFKQLLLLFGDTLSEMSETLKFHTCLINPSTQCIISAMGAVFIV